MIVLAIDPGDKKSGYCEIDCGTLQPISFGNVDNEELLSWCEERRLNWENMTVAIEMVASYGMPVGKEVFETCVWIGRFYQTLIWQDPLLVYRRNVKLHHCGVTRAKDSNVVQALVDRFAPGESKNKGKGTKADPGWFYGFSKDVWQAYALGVYVADTKG